MIMQSVTFQEVNRKRNRFIDTKKNGIRNMLPKMSGLAADALIDLFLKNYLPHLRARTL